MKLTSEHTDTTRQGTTYLRYYGGPGFSTVQVKVHQDPYANQSYGVLSVWTSERGYKAFVTASPMDVFDAAKCDLDQIADALVEEYEKLTGRVPS